MTEQEALLILTQLVHGGPPAGSADRLLFGDREAIKWALSEIARLHVPEAQVEKAQGFLADVNGEVKKARAKFPRGRHLLPALMEEVGELANALLEQEYAKGVTNEMIYREAVQVATLAMRIAEEGEDSFPKFAPPDELLGAAREDANDG